MTTVLLHGELGRTFGEKWRLNVSSLGEALRAIDANTNGRLMRYLASKGGGLAKYRVLIDQKDWQHSEELYMPRTGLKELTIMPAIEGAGSNGLWQVLIGVALIALSAIIAPAGVSFLGSKFFAAGLPAFVFGMGVTMTLGGFAAMLAPNPKVSTSEKPENQPSYMFSGPINTYRQGNPVPVGYGTVLVGSQVISAGIRASDLPLVENWAGNKAYVKGSEVLYNARYYRARQDVPAGVRPSGDENDTYWMDTTTA